MSERDLLEPRGLTSKELKALVDEYVEAGGQITICKPGVAMNFRLDVLEPEKQEDKKKMVVVRKNRKGKKGKK